MYLNDEFNLTPSAQNGTFEYWYQSNYLMPFDFDKPINSDITLYGLEKEIVTTHYSEGKYMWNLNMVTVKNVSVPKNYGEVYYVCLKAIANQTIKVYTTSSALRLSDAMLLAVDGSRHSSVLGNEVTIVDKGNSERNCPYITIKTTFDGWYYFVVVSKANTNGGVYFDIQAEILTVY